MLLLPSRLAPCHFPQRGRLWFYAQTKLVSPFGRDVAQRQRGLIPVSIFFFFFFLIRTCQRAALSVICPANASSPKGRAKKPVRTVRLTNQVIRIRTCSRAAPSVTACTVLPSSKRKAFFILLRCQCVSDTGQFILLHAVGVGAAVYADQIFPRTALGER